MTLIERIQHDRNKYEALLEEAYEKLRECIPEKKQVYEKESAAYRAVYKSLETLARTLKGDI